MRVIKFRVWDSISKAMHPWLMIRNNKFGDFDLDHYTLEQFTGLQDKNGVDIYEGDILEQNASMYNANDKINRIVVFEKGGFLNGKDSCPLSIVIHHAFSPLVIGNIHQK